MKRTFSRLVVASLCALAMYFSSVSPRAAEKDAAAGAATASEQHSEAKKKSANVPFHGKLGAVDKQAMTISIEGKEKKRVIHITAQTKIVKGHGAAKLDDATPGDEVAGQLIKKNGKEEAVSLRIGPKPEAKAKTKAKKEKH